MATHKQAEKRHRQSLKRQARNSYYEATLRSLLRQARTSLEDGAKLASANVLKAVSWIDHVAVKGIIPKTRASRLKSRLESQLAKR